MKTFSHSRLSTFRQCPRRYFYQYVRRVKMPEAPEQIATFFGSRCHDALEWLYGRVMRGVLPTRKQVLDEFGRGWDGAWVEGIVIHEDGMTPKRYRTLGEKCVGAYYDAWHPFDDATTIELEKQIRFPLDAEAGIGMTGFIDRLAKGADGTWHIHDYKTNRRLPTQADRDADPQLAYYEIGIRQMWPRSVERVELHWHFLRHGETITSTRTAEQLEELRRRALETIHDALGRGRDEQAFEPVESGLCSYCEYESICPVRRHAVTVKGLPVRESRRESGVKLVNRWSALKARRDELSAQIAEIDGQIEEVKEALAEYARRTDSSVIVGEEHEATVRFEERVVFPRKTIESNEYEELERKLLESDYWDQVSSMDANRLRTLWKQPESLPARLRRVLERYAMTELETKIGLRARRD